MSDYPEDDVWEPSDEDLAHVMKVAEKIGADQDWLSWLWEKYMANKKEKLKKRPPPGANWGPMSDNRFEPNPGRPSTHSNDSFGRGYNAGGDRGGPE